MNVLRHDHIAKYEKDVSPSHSLKGSLENSASLSGTQIRKSIMTTEGQEMKVVGPLKPL